MPYSDCDHCKGTGLEPNNPLPVKCQSCRGHGRGLVNRGSFDRGVKTGLSHGTSPIMRIDDDYPVWRHSEKPGESKEELRLKKALEYWKRRCELAEKYINSIPDDPGIAYDEEQLRAKKKWEKLMSRNR